MNVRHAALAIGLIGVLTATVAYSETMSAQDFVTKASVANMFEIESSKLALDNAKNSDVRAFAQRMIDDHTKTGERLKSVLSDSKSDIKPADKLDAKHSNLMDTLKAESSNTFDQQYITMQVNAHKEAVKLFTDYSMSGDNKALKDFAASTLPSLKQHADHVQDLKSK